MKNELRRILLIFWLFTLPAQADVTLDAAQEIPAGAAMTVNLSGDIGDRDFVTIVEVGTPDGKYSSYQYVRSKTSIELRAPEDAGEYELRYLEANPPYATLASRKLTVAPVQATVQAPTQVDAGAQFQVTWTGPDNPQDFISLNDPQSDSKSRKWITYAYTRKGSPVSLTAPDEPGRYEVAYRTGVKYYTLATATVIVAGTEASVQAPASLKAGQQFEVNWTGPDNSQDFITISAADADARQYHHYQYTRKGSPVILNAPDEPGRYEVRYQTGQTYTILASQSVTVDSVTATLQLPETVVGGATFEVDWIGPDNHGDFIAVMVKGSDQRSSARGGWAYTRRGNPATLMAPLEPGSYEVRYQTGQSAAILATQPLQVTPPPVLPGRLLVSLDSSAPGFGASDAVEIILDASGSMLKRQDGRRRIEIAREVLLELTGEVIPEGTAFALRVFGHKEADSCRTDLEQPLAPLAAAQVDAKIKELQAMNLAKTPIARSLELVSEDLAAVSGERVVILITDGEETCDGDPAAAIEALRASGIDVRINIVGFAIDEDALKSRFRYWADLGGGNYHDASSADDLRHSMNRALQGPYDVLDTSGRVVASGTVGDEGVDLPPGDYSVQTRTTPPLRGSTTVVSGKKTEVVLK